MTTTFILIGLCTTRLIISSSVFRHLTREHASTRSYIYIYPDAPLHSTCIASQHLSSSKAKYNVHIHYFTTTFSLSSCPQETSSPRHCHCIPSSSRDIVATATMSSRDAAAATTAARIVSGDLPLLVTWPH